MIMDVDVDVDADADMVLLGSKDEDGFGDE